jgi:hypothetical protein
MFTTSDDLHAEAINLLASDSTKPVGLNGPLDHPDLPVNPSNWPVVAVYIVEGDKLKEDGGEHAADTRETKLRVDLRLESAQIIAGTLALRTWVIRTLLRDPTLGGRATEGRLDGWEPYGDALDSKLAGAVLDFTFTHFWKLP